MPNPQDHQALAAMKDTPQPQASQGEVSALARHGDPSLRRRSTDRFMTSEGRPGGLQWVRASELLTQGGIRLADRGATSHDTIVRKMRRGMASINPTSRRGIARRSASSLPPLSVFGAGRQSPPLSRDSVSQ